MSAKDMIEKGDFEAAKMKYEHADIRWKNHWWKTCVEIYNKFTIWAQKYVIDTVNKIIKKKGRGRPPKYSDKIIWNCPDFENKGEQFYLVEFLDKNKRVIFSKVGTTTRTIKQRMTEELRQYSKKYPVEFCRVNRVYNLNKPAELLESFFRAKYINRWPEKFKKNDRFFDVIFDLEEADKFVAEILA